MPGVPPLKLHMDYQETYVEHPLFVTAEWAFIHVNDTFPSEISRVAELHAGPNANGAEGLWIRWRPYQVVPLGDPGWTTGIGFPYINPVERERLYPVPGEVTGGFGTEDAVLYGAELSQYCFGLAELAQFASTSCALMASMVPESATVVNAAIPNVVVDAGVQHAAVSTAAASPDGDVPALQAGAAGRVPVEVRGAPGQAVPGSPRPSPIGSLAGVGSVPSPSSPPLLFVPLSPLQTGSLAGTATPLPFLPLAVAGGVGLFIAWALYRRLRDAALLEHPARKSLLALVHEVPGITIARAAQQMGCDYKTAQYHADRLIADGHIGVHLNGRQRCLFPNALPFTRETRAALLVERRPVAHRFLEVLREGPLPRHDLVRRVPVGRTAAWRALRELQAHGWVEVRASPEGELVAATGRWAAPAKPSAQLPSGLLGDSKATAATDGASSSPTGGV